MAQSEIHVNVRSPAAGIRILDVQGKITGSAEDTLFTSCAAAGSNTQAIILNLKDVQSIDSLGAGVLIALLARVRQQRQRLLAYGLSEHCRRAFELTHLDEAVGLGTDEAAALRNLLPPVPSAQMEAPVVGSQAVQTVEHSGQWADPVDRLTIPPVPKKAINVNTEGRHTTGPVRGFGSLWRRTYAIRLVGSAATPPEVVRAWKERFASFWPPSGRYYGADKPIEAGDVALLNLAGPAGMIIATGIRVIYANDESFCFISAAGHMFGGMITFSAHEDNGSSVAQVQALLRASDPLFEMAVRLGIATKPEDRFWQGALKNLAAHFGVEGQPVSQQAVLLDSSLQWSKVKNLWHNAAIRNGLHMPVRWLRGQGAQ